MAIKCKMPIIKKRKGKNQFIYEKSMVKSSNVIRVIVDDNVDSPYEILIHEYLSPKYGYCAYQNIWTQIPIVPSQQSMCNPNSDYGSDLKGLTPPHHDRIGAQLITIT